MAPRERRRRGKGGLFKRGDGMWVGTVEIPTADGKRRQKRVYSKSYAQARDKLRALQTDITKGLVPSTATTTVAKWLPHWLETIHGPHVRPKTYEFYADSVRLHILPALGGKRLDRLTPEDVRTMLRGIESTRNQQRAHQVLKLALKAAINEGLLSRNVCDAVAKPKHLTKTRDAFTPEQARHIIRTAISVEETQPDTEPRLATRWALAFLTGARQAEMLGLEWDRVDLDAGWIDLSWQLQQLDQRHGCHDANGTPTCERSRPGYCPDRQWVFPAGYEYRECHRSLVWTRPKTKSGTRVVDLTPPALQLLRLHAGQDSPNPHNLVWRYPDGRPVAPKDDGSRWGELLKQAGMAAAPLHSIRHSTASMLQAAGVDEPTRMAIMGQSSVAAHRGYLHVERTQTRAAVANLDALLPGDGDA